MLVYELQTIADAKDGSIEEEDVRVVFQSVCIVHTVWATGNYDSTAEERDVVSFPFQFQAGIGMGMEGGETLYYKVRSVICIKKLLIKIYNY